VAECRVNVPPGGTREAVRSLWLRRLPATTCRKSDYAERRFKQRHARPDNATQEERRTNKSSGGGLNPAQRKRLPNALTSFPSLWGRPLSSTNTPRLREGLPHPRGATWDDEGVNFSLFSANGTKVEFCLFDADGTCYATRNAGHPQTR
jgi:hypothetical protein